MATAAEKSEDSEKTVEGDKPEDVVSRWLREIKASDEHEREWRERAQKIVNLYKDERKKGVEASESTERRFNILFANTEVLKGALYQKAPIPDIRRRWADKDPVGRLAALILNRAVMVTIEQNDLDSLLRQCVEDMVLPGRGNARVMYKPTIEKYDERVSQEAPVDGAMLPEGVLNDEQGFYRMEPVEEVTYECVEIDYIEWDMLRFSPAKRWKKLRWEAFGELLTRDDLVREFGDQVGNAVNLKWSPKGIDDTKEENRVFKRALVWTIFNKTQKKVIVVSDGYKDAPLKTIEDPLKLIEFFPTPRPLYSICTNDSMVPTPEYAVYQDHALDLDALEERISVLQEALRRRGVYDADFEELATLAKTGDNKFVPIKDYKRFIEKGGLEMALQEQDLTNLASVLKELMLMAEQKKQMIYEIIGISDIMRGSVDPQEKLGQSQLKSQYGSIRSGPRQHEIQRFARDIIRLTAEIIAEHFNPLTLQQMSGIELCMDDAELQQLAVTEPQNPKIKRPTWEAVMKLLRSDKLRGFKIGIETDSTLKPQADQEQKNRVELIGQVTGYLEKALPAVAQGMMPKKVASELLMFGVRAFPAGAQLEEMLDEWAAGGVDQLMEGQQQGAPGQQEANPQAAVEAAQAEEMKKQAAHADQLRAVELQTKTAELVKARASAYAEITKAEALVPGTQLDQLMQEANLKRAEAQASAAKLPPTGMVQ